MSTPGEPSRRPHFSYGRFVTLVLGSGVLVLVIGIPIILALAHWSPIAGLVAALLVVLAMIGTIGLALLAGGMIAAPLAAWLVTRMNPILLGGFVGLAAPAKTPKPVVDFLSKHLNEVLQTDVFKKRMAELGMAPPPADENTPEKFDKFMREETARQGVLAEMTGQKIAAPK